jgi:ubiquinol-cytochrome c reductase subunit 7
LLGLKYDDLLMETPEVTEAIRRLHPDEQIARQQRLKIAFDLSVKQDFLPKEKWLKPEEDLPYLRPIIQEVIQEKKEREAFRK